jgi:hypothetical protein
MKSVLKSEKVCQKLLTCAQYKCFMFVDLVQNFGFAEQKRRLWLVIQKSLTFLGDCTSLSYDNMLLSKTN